MSARAQPSESYLVTALFWALMMAAGPPVVAQPQPSSLLIRFDEMAARLNEDGVTVLDVRPEHLYSRGHLPSALQLPSLTGSNPARPTELIALLGSQGLTGSETVVLCGEPGFESELAAAFFALESAGVREVRILEGGIGEWRRRKGPVENGSVSPSQAIFVPVSGRSTTIGPRDALALLGFPGTVFVDTRAGTGWQLYEPTPEVAKGHVPTALSYDVRSLAGEGATWPLVEGAKQELARLGPRAGSGVDLGSLFILYGNQDADPRPALGYMILRLLGVDVRIMVGGWAGWTADDSRPVARIVSASEVRSLQRAATKPPGSPFFGRLPILDMRELRDWEVGHLPGAFPLSADEFSRFFDLVVHEYWPAVDQRRDPLVLYCYGPQCIRSLRGMRIAVRRGWRNIYWFRDGVAGWLEAGFELEWPSSAEQPPWGEEGAR